MANTENVHAVEYIGISDATLHMGSTEWLKRYLLLYDKIGLLSLEAVKFQLRSYSSAKAERADTYESLQDLGVIFEAKYVTDTAVHPEIEAHLTEAKRANDRFEQEYPSDLELWRKRNEEGREPAKDSFRHHFDTQIHLARATAAAMRLTENPRTFAILNPSVWEAESRELRRVHVRKLLINQFPVVEDTISFEDLLSLRSENEFKQRHGALRVWANKVASGTAPMYEIEEELLNLRNQYETYLAKIKVRYGLSGMSALFQFAGGLAGDVAGLNFGNAFGKFISLVVTPASLSEAEMKAPGREVSFFHYIQENLR